MLFHPRNQAKSGRGEGGQTSVFSGFGSADPRRFGAVRRRPSPQQKLASLREEPEERTCGCRARHGCCAPSISGETFRPGAACAGGRRFFCRRCASPATEAFRRRHLTSLRMLSGEGGSRGRWEAARRAEGKHRVRVVSQGPPVLTQRDTPRSRRQLRRKAGPLKPKRSEGAPPAAATPRPAPLTWPAFEAADRVAVAGPAPFPVVLLVELKHVDSYHVLSDAAQRRGRRRARAGVAAGGGRVPGSRRLDGAGGLAAGALPRRRAAAPMAQGPQQEAAGQAAGHRGGAAGRPGAKRRRLGRCLRLGLPVGPAAPGRGGGGAGREEGGWGRPPPRR